MDIADETASIKSSLLEAEELRRTGDYAACEPIVLQAIDASRRVNDESLLGWALLLRASLLGYKGQVELAYEAISQALVLVHDSTLRGRAMNVRAAILSQSGDIGRALEGFQQGLCELAQQHSPYAVELRCFMLMNLGVVLSEYAGEHEEAVRCCEDAMKLAHTRLDEPFAHQSALIESASNAYARRLCLYARELEREGQLDQARGALNRASQALMPITGYWFEINQLNQLARVLSCHAALGRVDDARVLALQLLRRARLAGTPMMHKETVYESLREFSDLSGSVRQRLLYEKRLLLLVELTGSSTGKAKWQRQIAQSHAELSEHAQALSMLKAYREQMDAKRKADSLLRSRLLSIERRSQRDSEQARQQQLHLRRLSVLGRLIGHSQHRLNEPLQRAFRLLHNAPQDAQQDAQGLLSTLHELNNCIDSAAALVSQLKLFSYRSRPQPTSVPLQQALLEAWAGLESHVELGLTQMSVVERSSAAQAQVWADPQRLAILFKILLVELLQDQQLERIRAVIDSAPNGQIELRIECDTAASDGKVDSLGVQLCVDIAQEMGGSLSTTDSGESQHEHPREYLHYRLRLPAHNPNHQEASLVV
jgi:tetratricopeptide (TPR) repeat protein